MKTVLIIAHMFPPTGGVGVHRIAKFVKYLPHFGWTSVVLTCYPNVWIKQDPSLLLHMPSELRVVGVPSPIEPFLSYRQGVRGFISRLGRWLSVPDPQVWWLPWVVRQGLRELRGTHIDALLVTGNPFSTFLAGLILKLWTGLPLLLDFRDGWIVNPRGHLAAWHLFWRRPFEALLAHLVTEAATRVITVSDRMRDDLANWHGGSSGKFLAIYNGYDPEDFSGPSAELPLEPGHFHILYVGTTDMCRSAQLFFEAIRDLVKEDAEMLQNLRVTLVGQIAERECQASGELNQDAGTQLARIVDYVPHAEAIAYLKSATVLLLILNFGESLVTSKVFEYVAAGKPILALVPPGGEAAQIVRDSGLGVVVSPTDVEGMRRQLGAWYAAWREGNLSVKAVPSFVERFSRRNLAQQLAKCLDEVS